MGPKKDRRVRNIEVPTDVSTEFVLGDTATDIQGRREEREARERDEEAQKQGEETRREETTHSAEGRWGGGGWQKSMQGQKKVTQEWTQGGREASTS